MKGGRLPNADHPISVGKADARIIVTVGGGIVADSSNALVLREATYPAVYYIPREEIVMDALVPTGTRTHCPYKGDASYFALRGGGSSDIAWSYEDTFDAMAAIGGHLAFYPDRVDAIETAPLD